MWSDSAADLLTGCPQLRLHRNLAVAKIRRMQSGRIKERPYV